MPKNTKTTKKTAVKSGQKSSLSSKFSALDGKMKFFLFIAIFLIVGAGYFAYKSFAATGGIHLAAANAQLRDGAYLITETGNNTKRNTKVAVIPTSKLGQPGYNASVGFTGGYTSTTVSALQNFINQNTGRKMRLCAFVSAPRTNATLQMINAYGGWEFKSVAANGHYNFVCTSYQQIKPATEGYSIPEVRSAGASAMIYVSSLEIEVIDSTPTY